ncbi:MAG TPA: chemotaxis protein CheW [Anaeromyxobacter sp.]
MNVRDRALPAASPEIADLLRVRAERLRAAPAAGDEEAALWVAEFPVSDERFALPLEALRAVLPISAVTPIPLSPPHVVGVLRYEGGIVSALSLASLLRSRGWRQDPAVVLVVDPGFGRLVALDCEAIPRAVPIAAAAVEAARAAQGGRAAAVEVVTPGNRHPLHVVDLRKLLELRREERHGA